MNSKFYFIPQATTTAGQCLTPLNWQEIGVTALSYSLESLLLKPGLEVLQTITDIKAYLGFSGKIIVNATSLKANKSGSFQIVSPFDGAKINLSSLELMHVIQHINPDCVLLPRHFLDNVSRSEAAFSKSIEVVVHYQEAQFQDLNLYFNLDESGSYPLFLNHCAKKTLAKYYLMGTLSQELMLELQDLTNCCFESNNPANDAIQGLVYSESGLIDIKDKKFEFDFELIASHCLCPTCSQGFTRAYLHHLLEHTPLLCQRFLIQHNVWQLNKK